MLPKIQRVMNIMIYIYHIFNQSSLYTKNNWIKYQHSAAIVIDSHFIEMMNKIILAIPHLYRQS